jgi:hypothetical protein
MSKEYITTSLSQGTAVKTKRPELPRVVLVGSFNDLFLEALTELKFEFELYKGSKAAKSVEFDIVVLSSDRADQSLDYIQKFKAVPIVYKGTKGFYDYNPVKEFGNAFIYKQDNPWHMLQAVIRAAETYKFPYDWKTLRAEVADTAKYL